MDNWVYRVRVNDDGEIWAGGLFTQAGPLTLADAVARWNGFSWAHVGLDIPGAPTLEGIAFAGNDIYLGFDTTGIAYVPGDNSVVNLGSAFALPNIEVKNYGFLQSIRNETMEYDIPCDMLIQDGEIVTIDLSTGRKTVDSTWRPLGRLSDVLPASDLGTFKLESHPRADYGAVDGANLITVFITDAAPRESGDNNNQLSGWENITGISQANTDLGRLYATIWWAPPVAQLVLYKDPAKLGTDIVGQTVAYNAPGVQPIVEMYDSGLGGSITIDAMVGFDDDIQVWFTIVTMFYRSRWWDLDSAVS